MGGTTVWLGRGLADCLAQQEIERPFGTKRLFFVRRLENCIHTIMLFFPNLMEIAACLRYTDCNKTGKRAKKMRDKKTKELCLKGMLTALVALCTIAIRVPVPATNGYIHLGDSMILLSGVLFGWEYGLVAGGLGSALADVLGGYAHWAPFTLVIKALMGALIGKLAKYDGTEHAFVSLRNVAASAVGLLWMIVGYLLAGTVLEGSFAVSLTSVPSNGVQAVGGFIIFAVLGYALDKAKIRRFLES